jgi:hypothetical protein
MQINQWRILGDQLLRKSPIEVKDNSNIWPSSSEKFDLGIYPSCTLSIALINPTREGMVGCRQVIQICKDHQCGSAWWSCWRAEGSWSRRDHQLKYWRQVNKLLKSGIHYDTPIFCICVIIQAVWLPKCHNHEMLLSKLKFFLSSYDILWVSGMSIRQLIYKKQCTWKFCMAPSPLFDCMYWQGSGLHHKLPNL